MADVPNALIELASHWQNYDALADVPIVAKMAGEIVRGRASGIDKNGNIQIETTGGMRCLNAADISVRPFC